MIDPLLSRLEGFYREDLGLSGLVPLHAPAFTGNEKRYVDECIDTTWVSSVGAFVTRFEEQVAQACGCRHGIAIVNGTAALHLALYALGIGSGDLVLCPALTFIGTANAIAAAGAQPLFVDSNPEDLGVSATRLADFLTRNAERRGTGCFHRASGKRIAALVPVHIFGHPVDFDPLEELSREWGFALVEDAAESLGSRYHTRPCGSLARVAALSFNGNKVVTTGGGGMLVTDDDALALRLKHLSTTARVPDPYTFDHDEPAFNYRLPNINAALGVAQMERLDDLLAAKRALTARYATLLDGLNGVRLFQGQPWADSNYWLNALFLPDPASRDRFLEACKAAQIQTRPCWKLLPDTLAWNSAPVADDLAGARWIAAHLVNIPSSPSLMAP